MLPSANGHCGVFGVHRMSNLILIVVNDRHRVAFFGISIESVWISQEFSVSVYPDSSHGSTIIFKGIIA
jgi:hypothetical protein